MQTFPPLSHILFTASQVPENTPIVIPPFCSPAMREYVDQVVAFMLRYYYIEDDNSSDFGDIWKALSVMGKDNHLSRQVLPILKKIEGFDLPSIRFACEAMNILTTSRFEGQDIALLVYHTLTNAFQSLASLSNNKPVYGFIESEYGHTLNIHPMQYAAKSFITNGVLAHVVCAKKGLSHIDTQPLMLHYVLITEGRLTHAGTEQFTNKTGGNYITELAIVLATGKTIWKLRVSDIPPHYLNEYKALLSAQYQAQLKGRL